MIIKDLSFLRQKSVEVSNDEALDIISLLEKELSYSNDIGNSGIGLAAPQIGILKKVAIVRINDVNINLINSIILEKYDLIDSNEGCLSLPGKNCNVKRYNQIVLQNQEIKFCAYGLVGICIQHEMDHWDGKVISDIEIVKPQNIGPNMPCPCGSKIKYKKCCGRK